MATPATPSSSVALWSFAGSGFRADWPLDAVAAPICHSVPSCQPALLSLKSSAKTTPPPITGVPLQLPAMHTSLAVHGSRSSHGVLLTACCSSQLPFAGLQAPVTQPLSIHEQ